MSGMTKRVSQLEMIMSWTLYDMRLQPSCESKERTANNSYDDQTKLLADTGDRLS